MMNKICDSCTVKNPSQDTVSEQKDKRLKLDSTWQYSHSPHLTSSHQLHYIIPNANRKNAHKGDTCQFHWEQFPSGNPWNFFGGGPEALKLSGPQRPLGLFIFIFFRHLICRNLQRLLGWDGSQATVSWVRSSIYCQLAQSRIPQLKPSLPHADSLWVRDKV